MFEQFVTVNFAQANYEELDILNVKSYDNYSILGSNSSTTFIERDISISFTSNQFKQDELRFVRYDAISSSSNHSVDFEIAELSLSKHSDAMTVNVNYDEDFNLNKRPHTENFELISRISLQQDSSSVQQNQLSQSALAITDERLKRKNQKRIDKKIESQSLVDLFNEFLNKYDSPIFIRQILKNNKMNIS